MEGKMGRKRFGYVLLIGLTLTVCCLPFFGFVVKSGKAGLDSLAYTAPELRVVETPENFRAINGGFSTSEGIAKFLSENDNVWTATVDLRRGVTTLLDGGAIPFIPGRANGLSWDSFEPGCGSIQCIPKDKIELLSREFLDKYPGLFPVKQEELVMDPDGTIPIGESFYLIRFQWVVNDIPVEGASIFFRINNGNLIQVASTHIAPITIDTTPSYTQETAWQILNGYLGEDGLSPKDEILETGKLVIIPTTAKGLDTEVYNGAVGGMAAYNLAYKLVFRRPGVQGTWEAMVDAHTGELLRFVDSNRYGRVHGGIRPSDGMPPEEDRPFPFADIGGGLYSDAAGMFSGNNATSTLTGKYAHIQDSCGSISNTTTTGDLDFLTDLAAGTDCVVPAGNTAGLGNTHSSRTLFYNTTAINLKAQTYNPTNTWLTSNYVILHVNGPAECNAGSSGLDIYFYKHIAGSCNNLGEVPGVAMHEWAHSYDTNDGSGGQAPPLETYADFTAIIQTHNSCTGAGFLIGSNCSGYGDACTGCTGVRDCDYAKHSSNTPWTSTNHGSVWSCSGGSYNGPCNWEDHCESGISSQALWDFVYRDLPAQCGMDITSGWMLEDRLWFTGVATLTASYTCSGGVTNGCSGTVLYSVMRALDDDGDGTANGTPHAHAIYHALNRHKIDCSTYNDASPQNANQTSCPALTTPVLSATAGSNSVALTWTTGGANATRYFVYKNESGCDVAFNRIAIVNAPTLSYTDNACANGVTYYYRLQAATANDSCVSATSNCVTAVPTPCAGTVSVDKALYSCAGTVTVTVMDSTAPASPFNCEAWSTSDATHRTVTVSGAPSTYTGTFATTTGAGGAGVVHVAAGDTLYVRYTDLDYCGAGSHVLDTTATIDCTGPVISNVQITNITGTTARITWTTDEAANSRVTYDMSTPPGTNKDDLATFVTSHTVNLTGLTTCSQYYFSVTSADVAVNSTTDNNGGAYYTFTTPNNNQTVWSENFTSASPTALPAGWTESHTSGNAWVTNASGCTGNALMYPYNGSAAANSYAYTPAITLTTGITYTFSCNQKVYSGTYPEIFEVKCGTAATPAGQTITVLGSATYTNTSCGPLTSTFTVPATGTYYLSFHCTSAANMWNLYIDDIVVSKPGSCTAELVYQSNTMTDACSGAGSGGGNAILEPGEDATIQVTMLNNGGAATGVSATLSTSTPGITVTDNYAAFPDIGSGGTGTSISNHYSVHVDQSVTCVTAANFTLHSTSTQNPAGNDSAFSINVGQAAGAVTVFSENFTSATPTALPAGWTESHTSGNAWVTNASGCAGNALMYPYNSTAAANSYAYTPGITLSSGVTYTLNFNQKTASSTYTEIFEVKCGTAATPGGQTITIRPSASYTNTACTARSNTFTVPTTGTYYISFHCTSALDQYNLYIDDIVLTQPSAAVCNVCVNGQNIAYQSHGAVTQITGDGDAWYEKGEKFSVQVNLTNNGTAAATNVTATFGGNGITVCTPSMSFGNIGVGGTGSATFEFVIDSGFAPCGGSIGFDITNKACAEITPAGSDQLDVFTINVGQGGPGSPANLVIQPSSADTYLNESSPGTNYGSDTTMSLQTRSSNRNRRVLVQFDLSAIPAGSTINSATLELYASAAPTNSRTLNVHRVTSSWVETTANWTNNSAGYDAPVSASVAAGTTTGWKIWTVTSLVQAWLGGTYQNYGMLVKDNTESSATQYAYTFSTKENATAANRPILRVNYTPPTGGWDCTYTGSGICISCATPSTPTIGGITDGDACAQSGISITYTEGAPATSSVLVVDSVEGPALTGSPYSYNPGNTASHTYIVRTYNTLSCQTDSSFQPFADANNSVGAPVIGSVTDVSACAQSGVTITWGAVAGGTGYDLYVDGTTTVPDVTSPYIHNPGDTNSHNYQVRAKNASCTGAWSTAVAGTDANVGIGTAAIISVTDINACAASGVTITWGAVAGATGYDLYVDGATTVPNVASPYTYTPVDTNSHNYQVRAKDAICTGSWSTAAAGTDIDSSVTAPSISGVADVNSCAQSGVTITWGAVAGATGYDLYVDSTTTVATVTSPYVYNPGNTASHDYQVRAKNASCTGVWSTGAAGTDVDSGTGIPTIGGVTDVNPCAQSGVTIIWGAVVGATGYDLYVDGATTIPDVTSPYIHIPGDTNSHNYQARAKNATCTGSWSTAAAGTDFNDSPTVQPIITSIVDPSVTGIGLIITYTAGSPALRHDLYRDGTLAYTDFPSGATYDPGNGLTHSYQINAVNGSCSLLSAPVNAVDRGTRIRPRPRLPLPELPYPKK
jgi:trimeric autotransporter adhesin